LRWWPLVSSPTELAVITFWETTLRELKDTRGNARRSAQTTVTSSQFRAGFGITSRQIEGFARSIARRLETEIPAYARVPGSAIEQDLIDVETLNLELYLGALADGRLPDPDELADLEVASGTRLRPGFPLEAGLRAGRLEAQAMWEIVVTHAPAESLARLATLTMQYLDLLNSV